MDESQNIEKQNAGGLSSVSNASTSKSTADCTTMTPFDGKGGDPTTIVGREVQWYYENEEPTRLEFKCSDGRLQFHKEGVTEEWDSDNDDDNYEVCMDDNLEEALDKLRGKQGKKLKILEAVTAQRESEVCGIWDVTFWKLKHRVIGIRLEGMDQLGYIFCKTERDGEDEDDIEDYELFFYDVILAPRWIKFRRH
ncbi:MAG: hypothetical protein Q9164_006394 [Protoblastenia rupestris]